MNDINKTVNSSNTSSETQPISSCRHRPKMNWSTDCTVGQSGLVSRLLFCISLFCCKFSAEIFGLSNHSRGPRTVDRIKSLFVFAIAERMKTVWSSGDGITSYLTALYWTVTLASSTGYGDILPMSPLEMCTLSLYGQQCIVVINTVVSLRI